MREHRPTHVLGVPTMVRMMLEHLDKEAPDAGALPSPTALVLGGAALDETTAESAGRAFGCPVVNLYGSADGVNCHTGLGEGTPEADEAGVAAGRPDPASPTSTSSTPRPATGSPTDRSARSSRAVR